MTVSRRRVGKGCRNGSLPHRAGVRSCINTESPSVHIIRVSVEDQRGLYGKTYLRHAALNFIERYLKFNYFGVGWECDISCVVWEHKITIKSHLHKVTGIRYKVTGEKTTRLSHESDAACTPNTTTVTLEINV